MPDGVSAPVDGRPARLTLNSDGQRHPFLNVTAVCALVAGVVAFVLGLTRHDFHLAATVLGIIGFAGGLVAQMFSATREQRIIIMTGVVAGFVGMALGIAHGGFA
jgi:hypothetical protein